MKKFLQLEVIYLRYDLRRWGEDKWTQAVTEVDDLRFQNFLHLRVDHL